jgi:hypothetical protein
MLHKRQSKVRILTCLILASALCPLLAACGGPTVRGASSSPTLELSLATGTTLAAIGVQPDKRNDSSRKEATWDERRIAFGLNNLLAEAFYDTGKFRLVEEKNLRQRQVIEELVELFWNEPRLEFSQTDLEGIATRLEANLLTYATIGYSRSSGQRIQIGPVGSYQQRLRVNVEVCLYEVSTHNTLCRQAEGTAQQEGVGVLYEFRNDRLDFEKSAAGRATKQAVTSAVQAIMASLRFTS